MLKVNDVSLAYNKRILFKDVNLTFAPGNCYGLIGANGAGKSTFLKILSKEIQPDTGNVSKDPRERIAMLRQDHFAFDDYTVLDTVIFGHPELYSILKEREVLYSKEEFSEKDGIRAAELEELVEEMNGYEAETDAAVLLAGLGIQTGMHSQKMKELEGGEKVRILLAQALFGNPDILLLDEPTNNLDLESITWLENFLYDFQNTVIVVSHDRHFMNKVCTHIADIDFAQIKIYAGNYDFWAAASELAAKQRKDANRKNEDKAKELRSFIERFSSNASKAKQATSRKKLLEKLTIEELPVTSRRFPWIAFKPSRECGKVILEVDGISKTVDGVRILKDVSFIVNQNDKIAFVGQNAICRSLLFQILMGEEKADEGTFRWGETITSSYFPKDNAAYFLDDLDLIDWLRQFSDDKDENFIRSFLGRMLFTGEETTKKVAVLSGGEKVRCMLARMMLSGANALVLDEPTNHLDLESITALNNGLIAYPEVLLFSSHDHQFIHSIANRIIEITPSGIIDRMMSFDDYITDDAIREIRDSMYSGHNRMVL
ncbi:MAG: ABC-F family ATP-binding cassette domain-containing protein [Spirochaetota bacterium]